MSESAAPDRVASAPWLFSPVVDLAVGGGLLALPVGLLAAFLADRDASAVVIVTAALALVVNGPHYATTVVRALRQGPRERALLLGSSAVAVVTCALAWRFPVALAWLFTAWVTWSPWHFAGQNHTVTSLFVTRAGLPPSAGVTTSLRALRLAHAAMAAAAILALHSGLSEAFFLRLGLSSSTPRTAAVVAVIVAVILGSGALRSLRRAGLPLSSTAMAAALLSTTAVWFVLPGLLGGGSTLLYVGGAAALLHGAQALWLAAFVEGRVAHAAGGRFDGLAFGGVAVAVGVGLFLVGPWVASRGFGADLAIALLLASSVVNLHHYVLDAALWRWQTPDLEPVRTGCALAPARRDEVSNVRAILATLGVGALLILGVVDVIQVAGSRADASGDAWARAATLNEHDSRLWVQSAQRAVADNDGDAARGDLGRAIALSPWNVDAQRALLRLHALTDHLDEAWARKTAAPAGVLDDIDSTVVLADVALRLERFDDAVTLGRRAVALSAAEPDGVFAIEARRVLGTALLERGTKGEAGEAWRLLRGALDDGDAIVDGDSLRGGHLLDLGAALGRAHLVLEQWDPASLIFDRVLEGATEHDRPDVAVLALIGKAQVALRKEDPRETLHLLQRALIVADARPDVVSPERVARAWLDYGGLLAASEAPMRLRLVCALKARQYAERMRKGPRQDELLTFITEATTFVEEVLPAAELEGVRTDVDAAAREALGLGYPDPDPDTVPNPQE